MTLPYMPITIEEMADLLIEIDRRLANTEGKIGSGLSHNDLTDIEDHKNFLKKDGSVPVTGTLDFTKSGRIKNAFNRILNVDIYKGVVQLDRATNQLVVDPDSTLYIKADGTVPLTADWDAGEFEIKTRLFVIDNGGMDIILAGDDNITIDGVTNLRTITLGAMRQNHTAGIAGTRAYHIDIDSNGFDDTNGIVIRHDLLNSSAIIRPKCINMSADVTGATNAHLNFLECAIVGDLDPSMRSDALDIRHGIAPIHHRSGSVTVAGVAFTYDDSAATFTDTTTAFGSSGTNVTVFEEDSDLIYVGESVPFETIEVILATVSSNPGIKPEFEYSKGASVWGTLTVSDDTNGFRENGNIFYTAPSDWATDSVNGSSAKYWVRIKRTTNNIGTPPIESTIKVVITVSYIWDKDGNVNLNTLSLGLTAGSLVFSDGSRLTEDNGNLFWDNTNDRLGVGTSAPSNLISSATSGKVVNVRDDTSDAKLIAQGNAGASLYLADLGGTADDRMVRWRLAGSLLNLSSRTDIDGHLVNSIMVVDTSLGNTGFGISPATTYRVDISGQVRISSAVNQLEMKDSDDGQRWTFNANAGSFNFRDASGASNLFVLESGAGANSIYLNSSSNVGIQTNTPTQPFSVKEKSCMTAIGGFAVKLTNKTGANTIAGQAIIADTANDDAVILTVASDSECFGVFLDSGVADGSEAWVVIAGIADVAMADNTAATRGNWVGVSTEAGYADATGGSPPAAPAHFEEIGHCIETVAAGGAGTHILARCVIHFN